MLIAIQHLGNVGAGVTTPQFFRADDGETYVVKLQNNKLGCKVLVSEFLGAQLGKLMDLCFPISDIITIDESLLDESPALVALGVTSGRHFASRYLANAEYVKKHKLNNAINIAQMAGVMLFDHMFHNSDRTNNKKNLLMRHEADGDKIYAIDNSHLFLSGNWTLESLTTLATRISIYYRYSYGLLLKDGLSPEDFIPYVEKVMKLSDEQLEIIVKDIPEEWLTEDSEREALIQYVQIRRELVQKIYNSLCRYIVRIHDGRRWLFGKAIK